MQITTYQMAVIEFDPNRPGVVVGIVAGPFENADDAGKAYAKLRDDNDALYDATGAGFIWYAVRYVEVKREIADADFADDTIDQPAEALGAGTFSARLAAYTDADAPYVVRATGEAAVGNGFAGRFASRAEAEQFRADWQTIAESAGIAVVYVIDGPADDQPAERFAIIWRDLLGNPIDGGRFGDYWYDRADAEREAARLTYVNRIGMMNDTFTVEVAPAAESFVTDYTPAADSVFELRAAEMIALNEVNRLTDVIAVALGYHDNVAYGIAMAKKRAAFEVYYAARLAREAVAPDRTVYIEKASNRHYCLRFTDTGELVTDDRPRLVATARGIAAALGYHVSYVQKRVGR